SAACAGICRATGSRPRRRRSRRCSSRRRPRPRASPRRRCSTCSLPRCRRLWAVPPISPGRTTRCSRARAPSRPRRQRATTCITALALTRQPLPQQPRTPAQLADIRRGGYVLLDCSGTPEVLVIATGSEVGIAAQAVAAANAAGRRVRLVSMPGTETFDAQDDEYRESVLPRAVTRRLAGEAGATPSWRRYV